MLVIEQQYFLEVYFNVYQGRLRMFNCFKIDQHSIFICLKIDQKSIFSKLVKSVDNKKLSKPIFYFLNSVKKSQPKKVGQKSDQIFAKPVKYVGQKCR